MGVRITLDMNVRFEGMVRGTYKNQLINGSKALLFPVLWNVTSLFAANVLGHVVLLDELIKAKKLNKVALYAGSEGARGVEEMGMKQPVKIQTFAL